jgi:hypothetical protein
MPRLQLIESQGTVQSVHERRRENGYYQQQLFREKSKAGTTSTGM